MNIEKCPVTSANSDEGLIITDKRNRTLCELEARVQVGICFKHYFELNVLTTEQVASTTSRIKQVIHLLFSRTSELQVCTWYYHKSQSRSHICRASNLHAAYYLLFLRSSYIIDKNSTSITTKRSDLILTRAVLIFILCNSLVDHCKF